MLKKLPVGLQSFAEIIQGNYLYVDKTERIYQLLNTGKVFFLSRPRRFGKSLTLSTIKEIYLGNQALFKGLWIEDQWDWRKQHPVIHLALSKLDYQNKGLDQALYDVLQQTASGYQISLEGSTYKDCFAELVEKLSQKHGQVVLLIDEYDKPMIDYLGDMERAKQNQATLKAFYSVLKDSDDYLEFLLITGVSKFSRVSIFSDLNHLSDLTLNRHFADLLGYTQHELNHYFEPYFGELEQLHGLTRVELLEQIRQWYNGYSWDGRTRLYNPFSVMSFLQQGEFRNFWFETGTPTFLLTLLQRDWLYQLDDMRVSERTFSSFDLERLEAIPILFQTGYLTLKKREPMGLVRLGYPNLEVKESLLEYMISSLRHEQTAMSAPMVVQIHEAFQANDIPQVIEMIKVVFKRVPSHIFIKDKEAYYHSLLFLVFFYLGVYSDAEVNDSNGRIDCVVKTQSHIYIIEFKLDKTAQVAMQQIEDKNYAQSFMSDAREKVLLGINFNSEQKTVDDWLVKVVDD